MDFPESFVEKEGVFYPRDPTQVTAYADGTPAEHYLESILSSVTDLSSGSLELREHIRNWPSRYHLSAERQNILRCLDLVPEARVLEIGAECGAVTRYLGERVREVVAVEANPACARLCRMRCRGLSNVRVLAGDIFKLRLHESFDIVTLIGTLECAGLYSKDKTDPFRAMLEVATRFLRPGGRLIVAIENQFGIKYFSGCGEDHGDPPFSGVEGYTEGTGVRTFGRHELLSMVRDSGLVPAAVVLPFPDYKISNSFVNAAYAGAEDARRYGLADWARKPFEDHERERAYLFDDHLTLAELARNGLLAEHSNSFLVVAAKGEDNQTPVGAVDWIAQRLNVMRHATFQSKTLLSLIDGKPTVTKQPLDPSVDRPEGGKVVREFRPEPFVENAESMSLAMVRALRKRRGTEAAFAPLLAQWLCFFREEYAIPGNPNLLRGEFVDCIPDNLVHAPGTSWQYVGRGWVWHGAVALDWVFFRGLVSFWAHHGRVIGGREWRQQGRLDRFVMRCFELLNSPLAATELDALRRHEAEFQAIVRDGAVANTVPTSQIRLTR